jgi:hypothetical protein
MVISLWKVNDRSTATLMGNFYKHISRGEAIGQSLHNSKLEYLETSDEISAQPVFWASFVTFGDTSPIKSKPGFIFWLSTVIVVIIIVYFLYCLVFRQKKL